jgi:hypothetical protein
MKPLPALLAFASFALSADPPAKPPLKIVPGQVVIPFDRMQRPWGELISLDAKTRTGTFRRESNDEIVAFTVMPYAELLHHAARGDLQDFRIGERAIFRLHENEKGEWVMLTYIQDEMNMMNGHKEFHHVESVDKEKGTLTVTQGNVDLSYVREKGIVIHTDKETKYWKAGKPAAFDDIRPADTLRTKTRGIGKGKTRIAWDVFLDEESLLKFQAEQKAVHSERLRKEGAAGYVDESKDTQLGLTLFAEADETNKQLKPGKKVTVAPAGVDKKPNAGVVPGTVTSVKTAGQLTKVVVQLEKPGPQFTPTNLARLWIMDK